MADIPHPPAHKASRYQTESKDNTTKIQCLYETIKTQAKKRPDAIAIAAPGRLPLSYKRLQHHIEYVVKILNEMGIGRHDRVAIELPNGPELAVAFLSTASGATSAPLNPAYGTDEFEFYLSDLNAKALIVQSGVDSPVRSVAKKRRIDIIELSPNREAEAGFFTLAGIKTSSIDKINFHNPRMLL